MGDKSKNIIILIAYFLIAIIFLGSMGVWLPITIDIYSTNNISNETMNLLPSNILTYSLGIFLIAAIDRIIYLFFKTSKYTNNILEFFGILFACLATAFIVFLSLKSFKNSIVDDAIRYAKYVVLIAWVAWFYVKIQGSKGNNFSAIGGVI